MAGSRESDPGSLHLGGVLDEATAEPTGEPLTLASDRLTTHGVIVGMTGSGKTGLGVVLLEEVLSAGIPALILDPKGDMGNLLLTFPELSPGDFRPWVDEGEARRSGVTPEELATTTASAWREGLGRWDIDGARIRALRDRVEMRIITPGSTVGIPLNLVGDLNPPGVAWEDHAETLRDEVAGLVSGLLTMAEVDTDPLTSREHILLCNLIEHAWRNGRKLDMFVLLQQIQDPPLRRLGAFELDTFFPAADRSRLAMRLNGLMASPSFAEWTMGEPLEVERLLRAPDGRPRASIVHLAHLGEAERTFVVTLLLTKLVTWMRSQPGTSELKALVYADEVVGFAPPTATPPTKAPLLTLYKQARAHGLGMVMATQNPVDLDYKLMSNAGTWMVGRLQTERDKARIIEGLRSASGDVDVGAWDARIGSLGKRQFLLKSASSSAPTLFTTRWAMSYLRGPLTRAELQRLRSTEGGGGVPSALAPAAPAAPAVAGTPTDGSPADAALAPDESPIAPQVAGDVPVRYLDPSTPWAAQVGVSVGGRRMEPGLAVRVRLLFDERAGNIRHEDEWEAVYFPLGERFDAAAAVIVDHDERDFREQPPQHCVYALGGPDLDRASYVADAEKAVVDRLFREETLVIRRNQSLKQYSRPGETAEAFLERCLAAAEDAADREAEKLRDRYEGKMRTARDRLAQAERRARELEVDVGQRKQQEVISGAGEMLSMFLGGRRRVRSLSGLASRRSRTRRTEERFKSALESVEEKQDAIGELEDELAEELAEIWERWREAAEEIDEVTVSLEKNDISVQESVVFWAPTA